MRDRQRVAQCDSKRMYAKYRGRRYMCMYVCMYVMHVYMLRSMDAQIY